MKVLVFAGSTRIGSFDRKLAREVAALARDQGAEVMAQVLWATGRLQTR